MMIKRLSGKECYAIVDTKAPRTKLCALAWWHTPTHKNVSDISFIYSEAKNTHIVLQNGGMQLAGQTLEELEEQLDPDQFFRANRQYIVNINSLESIHNHFNGKLKVVVKKS